MALLDEVKLSLRVTTEAFDEEIKGLIEAAKKDLEIAGINVRDGDSLINQAIKTYCRINFGNYEKAELLQRSYDSLKVRLQVAKDYRKRGGQDG